MDIIDEGVVVYNTADLVLATSGAYDYIFLGANITLGSGVTIAPTLGSLTIDGLYPLDGTGIIHTFTDMNSISNTDTLGVRTASSINLTLKNMSIIGRNYYGVPFVAENTALSGVVVTYENVTYSGPQMIYNPSGTTRFIDCDITIAYAPDTSRVEEVGEVCKVEMGGTVNINHTDSGDAVFWFRGTRGQQSFTVLDDANINIYSNSYFMFAAFYNIIFWDATPVAYDFRPNSSFVLNTAYGISLNSTHQASTFLVEDNASFIYTQRGTNGTNHSFYVNNQFTVNSGSTVHMYADFASTASLVRFNAAGAVLNIADPKSCVFYSRGAAALSFSGNSTFSIGGGQLNYWLTAATFPTAGTFNDIPASKWYKTEYAQPLLVSGTQTATATTVTASNFTTDELGRLPPLTNLHLSDARVLSIGDVPLSINPIVDDNTPITGTSDVGANIRVAYTTGGTAYTFETVAADGSFSVSTPSAIPEGTVVTVSANTPFLIVEKNADTLQAGELVLVDAPDLIRFLVTSPVSTSPLLLAREFPNEPVEVRDTRVYSTDWTLTATLITQLTTPSGKTLPNAVVFYDGSTITPLTSTPLPVYNGTASDGTPTDTTITYPRNQGILAHITTPIYISETYTGYMHWEVTAAGQSPAPVPAAQLLNNE